MFIAIDNTLADYVFDTMFTISTPYNLNAILRYVVLAILKPESVMVTHLVASAGIASVFSHPQAPLFHSSLSLHLTFITGTNPFSPAT